MQYNTFQAVILLFALLVTGVTSIPRQQRALEQPALHRRNSPPVANPPAKNTPKQAANQGAKPVANAGSGTKQTPSTTQCSGGQVLDQTTKKCGPDPKSTPSKTTPQRSSTLKDTKPNIQQEKKSLSNTIKDKANGMVQRTGQAMTNAKTRVTNGVKSALGRPTTTPDAKKQDSRGGLAKNEKNTLTRQGSKEVKERKNSKTNVDEHPNNCKREVGGKAGPACALSAKGGSTIKANGVDRQSSTSQHPTQLNSLHPGTKGNGHDGSKLDPKVENKSLCKRGQTGPACEIHPNDKNKADPAHANSLLGKSKEEKKADPKATQHCKRDLPGETCALHPADKNLDSKKGPKHSTQTDKTAQKSLCKRDAPNCLQQANDAHHKILKDLGKGAAVIGAGAAGVAVAKHESDKHKQKEEDKEKKKPPPPDYKTDPNAPLKKDTNGVTVIPEKQHVDTPDERHLREAKQMKANEDALQLSSKREKQVDSDIKKYTGKVNDETKKDQEAKHQADQQRAQAEADRKKLNAMGPTDHLSKSQQKTASSLQKEIKGDQSSVDKYNKSIRDSETKLIQSNDKEAAAKRKQDAKDAETKRKALQRQQEDEKKAREKAEKKVTDTEQKYKKSVASSEKHHDEKVDALQKKQKDMEVHLQQAKQMEHQKGLTDSRQKQAQKDAVRDQKEIQNWNKQIHQNDQNFNQIAHKDADKRNDSFSKIKKDNKDVLTKSMHDNFKTAGLAKGEQVNINTKMTAQKPPNKVLERFKKVMSYLQYPLEAIASVFGGPEILAGSLLAKAGLTAAEIATQVGTKVASVGARIGEAVASTGAKLGTTGARIGEALGDSVKSVAGKTGSLITKGGEKIGQKGVEYGTKMETKGSQKLDIAKQFFNQSKDNVAGKGSEKLGDGSKQFLKESRNQVSDKAQSAAEKHANLGGGQQKGDQGGLPEAEAQRIRSQGLSPDEFAAAQAYDKAMGNNLSKKVLTWQEKDKLISNSNEWQLKEAKQMQEYMDQAVPEEHTKTHNKRSIVTLSRRSLVWLAEDQQRKNMVRKRSLVRRSED